MHQRARVRGGGTSKSTAANPVLRHRIVAERLKQALKAYQAGGLTVREAANEFSVSKSTLHDRILGKRPLYIQHGGTRMTKEEETALANWAFRMVAYGFPVTRVKLREAAENIIALSDSPDRFEGRQPGAHWAKKYLRRHDDLAAISTEIVHTYESDIKEWFNKLATFMAAMGAVDILQSPSRIFGCDDISVVFHTFEGRRICLFLQDLFSRKLTVGDERLSVHVTFSAAGLITPSMIIYRDDYFPYELAWQAPENCVVSYSDNGCMKASNFLEYLYHFNDWLVHFSIQRPVILFMDGRRSHLTPEITDFAEEAQIILYSIPPGTVHFMHPVKTDFFGPLKDTWDKIVGQDVVDKSNFARIFARALQDIVTPAVVQYSFQSCGLFPLDPGAIDYSKCKRKKTSQSRCRELSVSDESDYFEDEEEEQASRDSDKDTSDAEGEESDDERIQVKREDEQATNNKIGSEDEKNFLKSSESSTSDQKCIQRRRSSRKQVEPKWKRDEDFLYDIPHFMDAAQDHYDDDMADTDWKDAHELKRTESKGRKKCHKRNIASIENSQPQTNHNNGRYIESLVNQLRQEVKKNNWCEVCSESFPNMNSLLKHTKVHAETPCVCDICGASVPCKEDMKVHMLKHSDKFPLTCEICGKTFAYFSLLEQHLRTHMGTKLYECVICDKKFSCAYFVQIHLQRVHQEQDLHGKWYKRPLLSRAKRKSTKLPEKDVKVARTNVRKRGTGRKVTKISRNQTKHNAIRRKPKRKSNTRPVKRTDRSVVNTNNENCVEEPVHIKGESVEEDCSTVYAMNNVAKQNLNVNLDSFPEGVQKIVYERTSFVKSGSNKSTDEVSTVEVIEVDDNVEREIEDSADEEANMPSMEDDVIFCQLCKAQFTCQKEYIKHVQCHLF